MSALINTSVRVSREAHAALVAFRRSKPWRGTFAERLDKFHTVCAGLGAAYGIEVAFQFVGEENRQRMGNGAYDPDANAIILVGKLSVVTFLHCYARARGKTRQEAFAWSLSVFAKMFPVSFNRGRLIGNVLIREQ